MNQENTPNNNAFDSSQENTEVQTTDFSSMMENMKPSFADSAEQLSQDQAMIRRLEEDIQHQHDTDIDGVGSIYASMGESVKTNVKNHMEKTAAESRLLAERMMMSGNTEEERANVRMSAVGIPEVVATESQKEYARNEMQSELATREARVRELQAIIEQEKANDALVNEKTGLFEKFKNVIQLKRPEVNQALENAKDELQFMKDNPGKVYTKKLEKNSWLPRRRDENPEWNRDDNREAA